MSDKPTTPRRTGSETGMMPRVDFEPDSAQESPQPPALPEFDGDMTSITGTIPMYAEGEDIAKQADDSSALEDGGPRQKRAKRG